MASTSDAANDSGVGLQALAAAIGHAISTDENLARVIRLSLANAGHEHRVGTNEIILRLDEVLRRTGLKRSTLYAKIAAKTFPAQVRLSSNCVGWYESEVSEWVRSPR